MSVPSKWRVILVATFFALTTIGTWHSAVAEDVVHAVSGIVKSVDKDSKTIVVKTADGTEHTIKYTDDTAVRGAKDTGKGVEKGGADAYLAGKEGTKVTVKYTEKGGEKTDTAIKTAGKDTAKAVSQ